MDIFAKADQYTQANDARAGGFYPYFQAIDQSFGTEVRIGDRRLIMIGSNNYLGLASDPRVKEAAIAAVRQFGSSCSGSRLLNGTLSLHEELERRFADFLGKESAIVFSTGFQTNLGTLQPLLGRKDYVFIDRFAHASLVDGIHLSVSQMKRFRHDDMDDLERQLASAPADSGKIIVVDGLFSMEGDTTDLARVVALKKRFGTRLMVDDAHGVGVMGAHGRGTSEQFGVEADVDLVMTTFSKSLGSLGGVIAGPHKVLDFIKHKGRALIFSAAATPAALGACLKSLEIVQTEPERRDRLWKNASRMQRELRRLGFNTGRSNSPIIPIVVGDDVKTFTFWKALLEAGLFTNPVISPAVAPGNQLIRTSYMATHTDEQLDQVLSILERVGRQFGLIAPSRGFLARGCE